MRRNKREFDKGLAVLLLVSCISITGCGGNAGVNRTVSDSAVSGSAVSGGAVSESAVNGENAKGELALEEKQGRFCTDTNGYYIDLDYIRQVRLDGTHEKKILPVNVYYGGQLYGVLDGWLYFQETSSSPICRIPIKKDAKGYDVVKTSKQEKVLETEDLGDVIFIYMDADYLFYIGEKEDHVIKYDWNRKKQVSEWKVGEMKEIMKLGEQYVAVSKDGGVFVQQAGEQVWRKVSEGDTIASDFQLLQNLYVQNERQLFYVPCLSEDTDECGRHGSYYADIGARVRVYDGTEDKNFVSEQQIVQAFRQEVLAGGGEDICCTISNIFIMNNRLYIQIQAEWTQDGQYHVQYVVLSQGVNESTLRYEKALSECMHSHEKDREGNIKDEEYGGKAILEHVVANDAQCIGMANGKAYISCFDWKKNKGRLGCYDFSSGAFFWLSGEDAVYRELCLSEGEDYYDSLYNSVFEKEPGNSFCDFDVFGVKGAYEGEFYEKKD